MRRGEPNAASHATYGSLAQSYWRPDGRVARSNITLQKPALLIIQEKRMALICRCVAQTRESRGRTYRSESVESDDYGLQLDRVLRTRQVWPRSSSLQNYRLGGVRFFTYLFPESQSGLTIRAAPLGDAEVPRDALSVITASRLTDLTDPDISGKTAASAAVRYEATGRRGPGSGATS